MRCFTQISLRYNLYFLLKKNKLQKTTKTPTPCLNPYAGFI